MAIRLSGGLGCLIFLLVLCLPAILIASITKSPIWLVLAPAGTIILMLIVAALPSKRQVSPAQFADELESHLLGTGGEFDWDDTTSIRIADERLE